MEQVRTGRADDSRPALDCGNDMERTMTLAESCAKAYLAIVRLKDGDTKSDLLYRILMLMRNNSKMNVYTLAGVTTYKFQDGSLLKTWPLKMKARVMK